MDFNLSFPKKIENSKKRFHFMENFLGIFNNKKNLEKFIEENFIPGVQGN